MTISRVITNLNKKAVVLLRDGRSQAALRAFHEALALIQARLHDQNHQNHEQATAVQTFHEFTTPVDDQILQEEENEDEVSCECRKPLHKTPSVQTVAIDKGSSSSNTPTKQTTASSSSCSNVFEFYPRAFVMRSSCQRNEEQQSFVTEHLVVLYNLAVTYHHIGIRNGHHPKFLKRALNVYNMAQTVLHRAWDADEEVDQLDKSVRLLLALAISNNVGHVHSFLLNFEETKYSLSAIRHFLEAPSANKILSKTDYVFFFRTVVIFKTNSFSIAPAA